MYTKRYNLTPLNIMQILSNKYIHLFLVVACMISATCGIKLSAQEITFSGNNLSVQEVVPEKNTGLDKIYIPYTVSGLSVHYNAQQNTHPRWYRYSNLGGGFAEEITAIIYDGVKSTLSAPEGDMGYIIEDGDNRIYFWIVNYEPYRFSIQSVDVSSDSDCDYTILDIEGNASPIHFFTINGQQRTLSRDIDIEYETEEWNASAKMFERVAAKKEIESVSGPVRISPPVYASTYFTVTGDRFMRAWNWEQQKESSVYQPSAILVQTSATQEESDTEGSNQMKSETTGLGGSAPAQILFESYTTEGVLHNEWQMSRDADFANVEYRFSDKDLDYTFTDQGTYYIRYVGSNSDGSCDAVSETYMVSIGASDLKCPNAFSPDGDGVNDEWKVAYRSITEFKCWIFDRNGHQLCYFDSPDKGWDGTYKGKIVSPGVYFYVVQATGADGIKYKKKGDINIIKHNTPTTNAPME